MVLINGRFVDPADYTATDGENVILDTGANEGDSVQIIGFSAFSVANVVNLTDAQSVNGVKTFSSSPLVPTVAAADSTSKVASTAQVQAAITARAATTTAAGIAELATNAETQAGSDATRVVTPAGLASVQANTSARGLIEIATNAEAQAMSDTSRAVTPGNLAAVKASSAEVNAGTSDQRFITPASLNASSRGVKAWVSFKGTDAVGFVTINKQFNVASVEKLSAGLYEITFANALPDNLYCAVFGNTTRYGGSNGSIYASGGATTAPTLKSTTKLQVAWGNGSSRDDVYEADITIFG